MLRRITLICCISFLIPVYAQAQAALLVLIFGDKAATENFHFSIDGGLNFVSLLDVQGNGMVAANFGLGTHIKINDRWTFAPEFKPLSGRGERKINRFTDIPEDIADRLDSYETRVKLNYIDVPLLFRYKLSDHFYAAAGPQVSFRTKANLYTEGIFDSGEEFDFTEPIEDLTEWYDFSFPLEIGYNFARNKHLGGVDIRFRYVPGLVTIADINGSEIKNNNFQLILSLPFLKAQAEE